MITAFSRYYNSPTTVLNIKNQMRKTIVHSPQITFSFNYHYYVTTALDTIDSIAYARYGDCTLWWRIADVNPEIFDWFTLEPGSLIRIPTNG